MITSQRFSEAVLMNRILHCTCSIKQYNIASKLQPSLMLVKSHRYTQLRSVEAQLQQLQANRTFARSPALGLRAATVPSCHCTILHLSPFIPQSMSFYVWSLSHQSHHCLKRSTLAWVQSPSSWTFSRHLHKLHIRFTYCIFLWYHGIPRVFTCSHISEMFAPFWDHDGLPKALWICVPGGGGCWQSQDRWTQTGAPQTALMEILWRFMACACAACAAERSESCSTLQPWMPMSRTDTNRREHREKCHFDAEWQVQSVGDLELDVTTLAQHVYNVYKSLIKFASGVFAVCSWRSERCGVNFPTDVERAELLKQLSRSAQGFGMLWACSFGRLSSFGVLICVHNGSVLFTASFLQESWMIA